MERVRIGVIGGSGVYDMEALQDVEEITLETPFGSPSSPYVVGTLEGQKVAFLARHGRGHFISPTQLPSRANIWGFKMLGVEYLISISACGSLKEEYAPGHIVIPDQLFDRTRLRPLSFFDDPLHGTGGIVVHISIADPFCPYLSAILYEAVQATGTPVHMGGTFVVIEGPRFSTKGESRIFRQWGLDIIGMTAIPEAFLAREAEMSYATMAHVTDYDVWHETEEPVSVEAIIETLLHNAEVSKEAVRHAVRALQDAPPSPYANALKNAIITRPELIPPEVKERLSLLVGKYLQ
ncbi:MAG: S-methyl-5'-thioadenosine phosphorylase [Anaerolineae bacterium]|nr:S-methyl-5'-thioadenosine phosphorylase [Anaerolineae bacterium]